MGIAGVLVPALLNRRSSRPKASLVLAKRATTDAGSLTSVGTARALAPAAPASVTVASRASVRPPARATE